MFVHRIKVKVGDFKIIYHQNHQSIAGSEEQALVVGINCDPEIRSHHLYRC